MKKRWWRRTRREMALAWLIWRIRQRVACLEWRIWMESLVQRRAADKAPTALRIRQSIRRRNLCDAEAVME